MATTIRSLLVRLGVKADNAGLARFDRGVTRVKAGMTQLTTLALGAAGAVAVATTAIIGATVATAAYGDENAKAAKRVGITVEEMQELAFAANISGAEMKDVENGLRRLGANAFDAAKGTGEAKDAFGALGVNVRDGNGQLKGQLTLLTEVAGALKGVKNDTEKVALAQDIFGRSGSKLLPLLNEGADGIEKLRQRARDLGIVMSEEATQQAELFNDTIFEAKTVLTGLRNTIGLALMPVLTDLVGRFRDWFIANRAVIKQRLERIANRIGKAFRTLADILERVDRFVQKNLGGWDEVIKGFGLALTGAFGIKAALAFGTVITGLVGIVSGLVTIIGTVATALGVTFGVALVIIIAALATLFIWLGVIIGMFAVMALSIEDLIVFIQGGNSAFGEMLSNFGDATGLSEALRNAWESLTRFGNSLNMALTRIANTIAEELQPAWEAFLDFLKPFGDFFADVIEGQMNNAIVLFNNLAEAIDFASTALERFAATGEIGLDIGGIGESLGRAFDPKAAFGRIQQAVTTGGGTSVNNGQNTSITFNGTGMTVEEGRQLSQDLLAESLRRTMAAARGREG